MLAGLRQGAGHGEGQGSAGGRANGWLQEGLVPPKVDRIFNLVEILGGQPNGGHGGDPGLGQITQVTLVHVPVQRGGGIAQVAVAFSGIDPLGKGFGCSW